MFPLKVTIIDRKGEAGKLCAEGCGVDWTQEENRNLARQNLRGFFGDRVQVEFLDLDAPSTQEAFQDIARRVQENDLLLPVLVVNGEVRISGFFDFRMLRDMVEVAGELGRG